MAGIFYTITVEDISHWPKPNYDNPVHRTWLPGYAIAWETLSTILVFARLYLRARNKSGSLGGDDLLIFLGWVFSIAFTTTACVAVWDYEVGRHVWDVRPDRYSGALYVAWIAQIMFIFSTGATKLSVLLFYARMMRDMASKAWLYLVYVLMFITAGSWLGVFIAYCNMCYPLHSFWSVQQLFSNTPYRCIDGDALTISVGVLTIASDFWTAAVPCTFFQYHDLGVTRRQRIALNVIFCLGFIVTGVGIGRTYYLWEIGHHDDLSWIGYDLFALSIVECQLGIICTCAPFLRVLFRKYFPDSIAKRRSAMVPAAKQPEPRTRTSTATAPYRGSVVMSMDNELSSPTSDVYDLEEKSGCLVREEISGRLVWSSKGGPRASATSSQDPPASPMDYT